VDTWWQTETGAIMISPVPGVTATKPGSCTRPLPGIFADIVDDDGKSVTRADAGGYLVIRRPWPSMLRTIWGDNERYLSTYWEKFQNRYYVAGDSAHRDKDGYFWIMGRIDDVLNVAGHRLGTMEIESALVSHPRVAESAVVGRPHEIKGESVFAYVVCRGQRPSGDEAAGLMKELRSWVSQELGAIARPDDIRFADNLPKTRSGKIMRRLLRSIARGEEITQDVSTLENPGILDQLRGVDSGPSTLGAVKSGKAGGGARKGERVKAPAPQQHALALSPEDEQEDVSAPKKSSSKVPAKNTSARKGQPTQGSAKKPSVKATPRKGSAKKAGAKATVRKGAAKKASARATPRKATRSKTSSRTVARKTPARKATSRTAARQKTAARKPAAKAKAKRRAR
jgi:hypothetical protein